MSSLDSIFIHHLRTEAIIGVYDQERLQPQPLLWDIKLSLIDNPAKHTDQLADTVDYAAVCHKMEQLVAQTQYQLIEALAEQAAKMLLAEFNIASVELTIYKKPYDLDTIDHIALNITRSV